MVHYQKPTLLRHGKVWVYHFPSHRQVTIRCPRDNVWVTRTRTLAGAGLIHNATRCSITSGEIRTLPELHGVAHADLIAPSVYVPGSSPILSKHELPRVEKALTPGVNDLDQLKDRLETEQKSLDVDMLVHIQKATPPRETPPHWHLIITAVSCALKSCWHLGCFSSRNFSVLSHVAGAQTRPRKMSHPGPQRTPFRLQKTRQPLLMRNHDATV